MTTDEYLGCNIRNFNHLAELQSFSMPRPMEVQMVALELRFLSAYGSSALSNQPVEYMFPFGRSSSFYLCKGLILSLCMGVLTKARGFVGLIPRHQLLCMTGA